MALHELLAALTLTVGAMQPSADTAGPSGAPAGTATTRYCLRVDPITGSRMETIECRTREHWAALEVDVDQEWAENGVRVIP